MSERDKAKPAPPPKDAEHDIEEAVERNYGKKIVEPLREDGKTDREND